MTRATNATIASFTLLIYLAAAIACLVLKGRAHATDVLPLLTSLSALVLGLTFYAQHDGRRARQQPKVRGSAGAQNTSAPRE